MARLSDGAAGVREHPAAADLLDTRAQGRAVRRVLPDRHRHGRGDRPPNRPSRRRFRGPGVRRRDGRRHDGGLRQRAEDGRHDLSGPGLPRRRHAAGLSGEPRGGAGRSEERDNLTRCDRDGIDEDSCSSQGPLGSPRSPGGTRVLVTQTAVGRPRRRSGDDHPPLRRDRRQGAPQARGQRRLHRAGRPARGRRGADRGDELVRRPAVRGVAVGPAQARRGAAGGVEPGQRDSGRPDRRAQTGPDRRHQRRPGRRHLSEAVRDRPHRSRSRTATRSSSRGRTRPPPSARRCSRPTR